MTVSVQIPYNDYFGNGAIKLFSFTFGLLETADLLVLVDQVVQVENSNYTVVPPTGKSTFEDGGDVLFTLPPDGGSRVLILRKTTVSQNIDYTAAPFPSETHEGGYDKLTYILQELITGVLDGTITFDLSVIQGVETVTIVNSGGTDAVLPAWVSATLAGVFMGEITITPPTDGDATTEADGKVWFGV